jgi:hypothetical protein
MTLGVGCSGGPVSARHRTLMMMMMMIFDADGVVCSVAWFQKMERKYGAQCCSKYEQ